MNSNENSYVIKRILNRYEMPVISRVVYLKGRLFVTLAVRDLTSNDIIIEKIVTFCLAHYWILREVMILRWGSNPIHQELIGKTTKQIKTYQKCPYLKFALEYTDLSFLFLQFCTLCRHDSLKFALTKISILNKYKLQTGNYHWSTNYTKILCRANRFAQVYTYTCFLFAQIVFAYYPISPSTIASCCLW